LKGVRYGGGVLNGLQKSERRRRRRRDVAAAARPVRWAGAGRGEDVRHTTPKRVRVACRSRRRRRRRRSVLCVRLRRRCCCYLHNNNNNTNNIILYRVKKLKNTSYNIILFDSTLCATDIHLSRLRLCPYYRLVFYLYIPIIIIVILLFGITRHNIILRSANYYLSVPPLPGMLVY